MKLDEITDIKVCLVEFCEIVDYSNFDSEERNIISDVVDYMKDYVKLLETNRLKEIKEDAA